MSDWQGRSVANGSTVTIGVFDGVHKGHQALIGHAIERARAAERAAVVITFDPNPLEVLRPEQAPTRLTSIERRVSLIESLGADEVVVLPFDPDLASMSAQAFTREILQERLAVQEVVIGEGFRFGHRAQGTVATLREAGLDVLEYSLVGNGDPISSTRIRFAIGAGDVAGAADMLGRAPEVDGIVVRGQQRGRALGYPTANVAHHPRAAVPADGVYAGRTEVAGRTYPAAISVGSNPTFEAVSRTVESYLLDVDVDIYGQQVRVEFVQRLRGMEAFSGVEELVATMRTDVVRTRAVLDL